MRDMSLTSSRSPVTLPCADDTHRDIRSSEHVWEVCAHCGGRHQHEAHLPEQKGIRGEGSSLQTA